MAQRQLQDILEFISFSPHQNVISGPKFCCCTLPAFRPPQQMFGLVHNCCQYPYFFFSRLTSGLTSILEYFSIWQQWSQSTCPQYFATSPLQPLQEASDAKQLVCTFSFMCTSMMTSSSSNETDEILTTFFSPGLISFEEKHRQEVTVLSREAGSHATARPVPVCFCSPSTKLR